MHVILVKFTIILNNSIVSTCTYLSWVINWNYPRRREKWRKENKPPNRLPIPLAKSSWKHVTWCLLPNIIYTWSINQPIHPIIYGFPHMFVYQVFIKFLRAIHIICVCMFSFIVWNENILLQNRKASFSEAKVDLCIWQWLVTDPPACVDCGCIQLLDKSRYTVVS